MSSTLNNSQFDHQGNFRRLVEHLYNQIKENMDQQSDDDPSSVKQILDQQESLPMSSQHSDSTLTENFSDHIEEDSKDNHRDSNISHKSKPISKELKPKRKPGRKPKDQVGGICIKCNQHGFSLVKGKCKKCIESSTKDNRGCKRIYADGTKCSRCQLEIFGAKKMCRGMCKSCYVYCYSCQK